MSSFVDKPGVPLLTFASERGKDLPVTQQRFFLDAPEKAAKDSSGWTIPVCVKTSGAPQCSLVSSDTSTLKLAPSCVRAVFCQRR